MHFSGPASSVELANAMKPAINLSRLGESTIIVDLRLGLREEVAIDS